MLNKNYGTPMIMNKLFHVRAFARVRPSFHFRVYSVAHQDAESISHSTGMIRNVGIIAHVDHGKTTLVDSLLKQSGCLTTDDAIRVMDSNELERERGITILSKCTSIRRKNYHINIVDTPGHADFGGEVERILSLVDGVILLVDASSGPQAQTRFVLSKALKAGLKPIVVQNKVDRSTSRCEEVDNEILDLFMKLDASDEQLMYPTFYASAREGWALKENPILNKIPLKEYKGNMDVLYDAIIEYVPPPIVDLKGPFKFLVNNLEANSFLGRCQMGRIESGSVKVGDFLKAIDENGKVLGESKVTKLLLKRGLEQFSIPKAEAGDIVTIAGLPFANVNSTICSPKETEPLKPVPIDPPTLTIDFMVNESPINGTEGKVLTLNDLDARLKTEGAVNVALNVEPARNGRITVHGRGELQLGILMETMRREGFEFAVGPPKVVFKRSETGQVLEPIEDLFIYCTPSQSGTIIQRLMLRKCEFVTMEETDDACRIHFYAPTRSLMGYFSELRNMTGGTGAINHQMKGYEPYKGPLEDTRAGAIISLNEGGVTAYAMQNMEDKGTFFVGVNDKVYPGMVIGEHVKSQDLEINLCKEKKLVNTRSTNNSEFYKIRPHRQLKLEEFLAYMREDEILEVTPKALRLRKVILNSSLRKRERKHGPMTEPDF